MQDRPKPARGLSPDVIARFRAIVGPAHAVTDPDQQLPYLREWRDLYFPTSPLVLRPASVAEVSACLALADAERIPVVPQAGNTGLVGGQVPMTDDREIVLSLERLKAVRAVDAAGGTMTVEAGLTLAECQDIAERAGRLFPLSLPSQGSCRIGGNIATNAGGVGVLAYGNTRQLVLGLEAVLPDGSVFNGLSSVKKDNTGFDIKQLFIGSEGALGVITAAVLRLFPRPAETATAFLALPRLEAALDILGRAQAAVGNDLTAFEFIPRLVLEFVTRHVAGARDPFPTEHPWYLLMEVAGRKADGRAAADLEAILADAAGAGLIEDAVLASSLRQARDLWKLREAISEAQKPEGGNIKHDVSVPIARIPEFVARANARVETITPGARPLPLGHFGDGNVHYNIAQPVGGDRAAFLARAPELNAAVHAVVIDLGGSISAEHGIGQARRDELARLADPVKLRLMRTVKQALDPHGIMNPGKVL